ncbi:MAG: helix-hairpin-helix domain-containing protein [candidate division Zixibacteria bacterium]|nr:helix-hairpin-helix domain-containing protein [candidate division Zixibacteria bacterium]MDH3937063.1 helix-hairpin-helix domain-containing protein [candidate division Zixibacteria bacterium]MDH4032534.1 helix-hairpin-helix domain-containing protein [candidate division Zixibacteria bacterium]
MIDYDLAGAYIGRMIEQRKLIDLVSVGPATLSDFDDLGITEVEHLLDKNARELYEQMQKIKGQRLDPCCEDVFRAAIEQARDPNLAPEKRVWHYWSKVRKGDM